MYIVEFQKRGPPHAHILLWLNGKNKLQTAKGINRVILAKLPHANICPKIFKIVASYTIHGPCGAVRFKSPCMK